MRAEEESFKAEVRDAWGASLPHPAADLRLSWREAGGDSLAALHLLFRLETALGRKLSFDLLAPDITLEELTTRLGEVSCPVQDARAPLVFLLPGIYGDEPILADFRRAMSPELRFEVIDLPELDSPSAMLRDLVSTGRFAAEEIARRAPAGPLRLAGFSFGAGVAYEAALELRVQGRDIDLLVLLDAPMPDTNQPPQIYKAHLSRRRLQRLDRAASAVLAGWGADDSRRRWLLRVARPLGIVPRLYVRRRLLHRFRGVALRAWQPRPTGERLLLVMSGQFAPGSQARWAQLAPLAETIRLPGAHLDLFQPAALAVLRPALLAAI